METHLASMENVTCWAFRKLCKGATDSYTGMLSLTNLVKRANTWREIDTYPIEDQRQWIQIATSKEAECSKFLEKLEKEIKIYPEKDNIYGIQLNCSCPSPSLIRIGQGPALIKRPTKVCTLIQELLKGKYKVGIKLRLGLNETEVRQKKILTLFKELERIAEENSSFTNVTVHFKHAHEMSSANYDYSLLNELASYNLPLVINGGIKNSEDVDKLMKCVAQENKKNIKGVMIGREAIRNPDCFLEIKDHADSIHRNFKELNEEFEMLCKLHMPKEIYLKTLKEKCTFLT